MSSYNKLLRFYKDNKNVEQGKFFDGLASLFGVTPTVAMDIWYAEQRSWFKPEMIDEIVRLANGGDGFYPVFTTGEFSWDKNTKRFIPERTSNESDS